MPRGPFTGRPILTFRKSAGSYTSSGATCTRFYSGRSSSAAFARKHRASSCRWRITREIFFDDWRTGPSIWFLPIPKLHYRQARYRQSSGKIAMRSSCGRNTRPQGRSGLWRTTRNGTARSYQSLATDKPMWMRDWPRRVSSGGLDLSHRTSWPLWRRCPRRIWLQTPRKSSPCDSQEPIGSLCGKHLSLRFISRRPWLDPPCGRTTLFFAGYAR
jgi:hypothetical protein